MDKPTENELKDQSHVIVRGSGEATWPWLPYVDWFKPRVDEVAPKAEKHHGPAGYPNVHIGD